MAKHLSVILKQYSDVISGKLPASKVTPLKTGDLPGVDYAGKMQDERDFVAAHSVEKHPDRNGNGDDLFNAANIAQTEKGRHGHIPSPADIVAYKQANEEVEISEKYSGFKKTEKALAEKGAKDPKALAAWIGRKKYGKEKFQKAAAEGKKLKEAKDDKDEREYGYEGEMAISQIKSIMNHANMLMKMLKPDTDMPEWVQSKITLANDYIQTAADYFATEMTEETENDDGWYAHREMHGSKGVSKEDWKKGYRLNSKGEKVMTKKSPKKDIKEAKCNMSEAGTMCEVHGTKACPSEETSATDKEPRFNGKDKAGKRKLLTDKNLQEKAESVAQQKLMAMALAYKRGEMKDASPEVKKLASSMTEKQLRDFAATKHEGLPKKVQKESAPAVTPITFPVTNSREGFKL